MPATRPKLEAPQGTGSASLRTREINAPKMATPEAVVKLALKASNKTGEGVAAGCPAPDCAMTVVKMAPARPMPNTMPIFLEVARMPAAIPWRRLGAEPMRALLLGEMKIPVPRPVMAKPATI